MKVSNPVLRVLIIADHLRVAYAPVLLEQRAQKLRKGNDVEKNVDIRTVYEEKMDREYVPHVIIIISVPLTCV